MYVLSVLLNVASIALLDCWLHCRVLQKGRSKLLLMTLMARVDVGYVTSSSGSSMRKLVLCRRHHQGVTQMTASLHRQVLEVMSLSNQEKVVMNKV